MEEIRICVVGMGYVGLPLAIAFSEKNFKVIGFDNNSEKIEKYLEVTNDKKNRFLRFYLSREFKMNIKKRLFMLLK